MANFSQTVPCENSQRSNFTVFLRSLVPLLGTMLDLAYKFGQNDFQPQALPSVSVGDVIDLGDRGRFLVASLGFTLFQGDVQELADGNVRS